MKDEQRPMNRFENILKAYRAGALNQKTAEFEVACEITPANVADVMPKLPPELVEGLSRWNFEELGIIVGSNLTPAEEATCHAKLAVARPAMRDWFAKNGSHVNGAEGVPSTPREMVEN